jgi:4-amino-4-deoxy-L-arabinose transferase-like glycosyltransferase
MAAEPPRAPRSGRASALFRDRVLLVLLAFGAVLFVYRWGIDDSRPHGGSLGWHAFHDQGFYYVEASFLAHFKAIPVADFLFPPGYPLLAVPFSRVGALGWPSGDPFFTADLLVWLLTVATMYLVGRRLFGQWFGLACALAVMLATPLVEYTVIPLTSTAVLGALMATLLVSLARDLRWWHGAVLGVAVAFAYSARYVDAIWIAGAAVTVLVARGGLRWRSPAWISALVAGYVALLPMFFLHRHAFGSPFARSYSEYRAYHIGGQEFSVSNIVPHALEGFVSPFYFDENGFRTLIARPMLSTMFLVVLAPLGWFLLLRRLRGEARILAVGFGLTTLAATIFYLSFSFTGSYGLQFGGLHYYKAWWPLWTFGAVAGAYLGVLRLTGHETRSSRQDVL